MAGTPQRGLPAPSEDQALLRIATDVAWDAYEHLIQAAQEPLGRALDAFGLGSDDEGSRLLLCPDSRHILFNRALADRPEVVPLAAAVFRRHGVRHFLVAVPREHRYEALQLGEITGLRRFRRPWMLMAKWIDRVGAGLPLDHAASHGHPSGTEIRRLERGEVVEAANLLCHEFGMPTSAAPVWAAARWRDDFELVGAWSQGSLVGVGILYVSGHAAYLGGGVVSPAFRRQGIQRALIRARAQIAIERGARVLASETGMPMGSEPNPSFQNLREAGLRVIEVTEHLCPPGTTW